MTEFIQSQGGLILTVILVATALNLFLSGLGAALDMIKDKTETQLDNQIALVILKITDILKRLVDLLSANRPH